MGKRVGEERKWDMSGVKKKLDEIKLGERRERIRIMAEKTQKVFSEWRKEQKRIREEKKIRNGDARKISRRINRLALKWGAGVVVPAMLALTIAAPVYERFYFENKMQASQVNISVLPDIAQREQMVSLYDRDGGVYSGDIAKSQTSGYKKYVPLTQISPFVVQATIATEDKTFQHNPGYNILSIGRAVKDVVIGNIWELLGRPVTEQFAKGASTITQQLARNLLMDPEFARQRSGLTGLDRKIQEVILAAEITKSYSKDEIMEMYLNTIYYGNMAYGIEEAAQVYFGKSAKELDLAESSFLAGLPQAPALYDVYSRPRETYHRQLDVLDLMVQNGYISKKEKDEAVFEMSTIQFSGHDEDYKYPYFRQLSLRQLKTLFSDDEAHNLGLAVYTTVDPEVQTYLEEMSGKKVLDSGIVIDANSGKVLAMAGQIDPSGVNIYKEGIEKSDFNLVDLVMAFSIQNGGTALSPVVIDKVMSSNGKTLCRTPSIEGAVYSCPGMEVKNIQISGIKLTLPYPAVIAEVEINGQIYSLAIGKDNDKVVAVLVTSGNSQAIETMMQIMNTISDNNDNSKGVSLSTTSDSIADILPPYIEYRRNPETGWNDKPYNIITRRYLSPTELAEEIKLANNPLGIVSTTPQLVVDEAGQKQAHDAQLAAMRDRGARQKALASRRAQLNTAQRQAGVNMPRVKGRGGRT